MKPAKKRILHADGHKYLGVCRSKLAALEQLRDAGDVLKKSFHLPDDLIATVVCGDVDMITIMKIPFSGFLFHPRVGDIDWMPHNYWAGMGFRTVRFPYVKGTGWDFNGDALPGTPVEYPLADDDHGTRRIERLSTGSREWKFFQRTPENYGNIDWKGLNTAKTGEEPNNPILTWRGPRSRYFAEAMEYPATGEPYYSANIYQSGKVLTSVPVSEKPATQTGEIVPYVVLGAALTTDEDGETWLVAVLKEYFFDLSTGESRNGMRVAARKYSHLKDDLNGWHDEESNPEGWRILFNVAKFPASSPFHFNSSGTESSSVHEWVIYTVTVNINTLSAEMATVAAADNITGTGHQEGTGIMTGTYSGWDGAVYSPRGELVDPLSGIWLDGSNNYVGSCNYYQGGYGSRSERVEAVCAVDYQGDTKVEARLSSVVSSKKETAIVTNISATATTLPGTSTPTRGAYHGTTRTGTVITYDCKVTLSFGNIEEDVYTETIMSHDGTKGETKYSIIEWSGNTPVKLSGGGFSMTLDDEERDRYAGAVLFLDLRHDIAVLARRRLYGKTTAHTNHYTWDYESGGASVPVDDESTATTAYETIIKISGAGADEVSWYEQFVFTDDDDHITMQDPSYASITDITADYAVQSIHFRYSNQPAGSWAVDRNGNHFYSMLKLDGTHNYLTGGDPVTLTETVGDNPVFFPIAPI